MTPRRDNRTLRAGNSGGPFGEAPKCSFLGHFRRFFHQNCLISAFFIHFHPIFGQFRPFSTKNQVIFDKKAQIVDFQREI